MRLAPYEEIFAEKEERRRRIKELEFHASGHAIHIGKISPGCRGCFSPEISHGIQIGTQCMMKCAYCYYDPKRTEMSKTETDDIFNKFTSLSRDTRWSPIIFAIQSSGETLMYMDELDRFIDVIKKIAPDKRKNFYLYAYTNGLLVDEKTIPKLKEWGVAEFRFHVSASNFSPLVFRNMEKAVAAGFTASVELPSLPHLGEKIMEMLPRLNTIGVKHLNLIETQVTPHNKKELDKLYPDGRAYQDFFIHLYDEGLVYDVMEEVVRNRYGFSVLDCNSGVERARHGPGKRVMFDFKSMDGMCAEWPYYVNAEEDPLKNARRT